MKNKKIRIRISLKPTTARKLRAISLSEGWGRNVSGLVNQWLKSEVVIDSGKGDGHCMIYD
jgi:hypothetical protein